MNKLKYGKTFLLGFGFFAISVMWSVYNAFMPLILKKFIGSAAVIGFIMTIDNYLAIIIQPVVGALSDKIDTRFGKRMPFIMAGMPIASIMLILLANYSGFVMLIIFLVLTNLTMSIFRSPVISLMPDITHKENRSKANSIINFMGGIGAVIAYFVGSKLWKMNPKLPFYLSGILMLVSFIIIFIFIKEKRDAVNYEKVDDNKGHFIDAVKIKDKNITYLLMAICSWFIAYQGIEAFLSLYGVEFLKIEESAASMLFTFISISFLLFSIPAGIVGTKIGKKKAIVIGVIGLTGSFCVIALFKTLMIVRIMLAVAGFFWAMININSYPFVADMASKGEVGKYTGLYYLASSIAAIVSPPLLGLVIDLVGYKYMFFYGMIFLIFALIFMQKIKIKGIEVRS
jgi:MFS family permease